MNMAIFQENPYSFRGGPLLSREGQDYWKRQQKEVEVARKPPPKVGKEPNSKHLKEQGE